MPSSITQLTIFRHGETVWNAEDRLQGQLPTELSPRGHRQAEAVARRLSDEQFDAIYASDLRRALQTVDYLAAARAAKVIEEPRLRERSMGVFDGLLWPEVQGRYPEAYAEYKTGRLDFAMPEGESSQEVYDRVIPCIEELASRHAGQHLAVCAHGGVLQRIFRFITDSPRVGPRRFSLYNAAINRIARGPDGWRIETWGDIAHLHELGTHE